jgi:hypothetical protein
MLFLETLLPSSIKIKLIFIKYEERLFVRLINVNLSSQHFHMGIIIFKKSYLSLYVQCVFGFSKALNVFLQSEKYMFSSI